MLFLGTIREGGPDWGARDVHEAHSRDIGYGLDGGGRALHGGPPGGAAPAHLHVGRRVPRHTARYPLQRRRLQNPGYVL